MSADVNAMIRAGQQALKAGDKAKARQALEKAVELDQHNETAWLWLSAVVESKEEQQICLQNVLVINPDNERARMGLKSLGIDPDSLNDPEPEPEPEADEYGFDEYGIETSSASSNYQGDAVSGDDYDGWMDDLGIGDNTGGNATMPVTPDFASDDAFFEDEDDLFGDDGMDRLMDDDFGDDSFEEGSFDEEGLLEDFQDYGDSTYFDDEGDYDDEFAEDEFADDFQDTYVDEATMGEFTDAVEDDLHGFDDHEEFGGFNLDNEFPEEKEEAAAPDPDTFFRMIPKEISAASRLPGEDKPTPTALMAAVGVLVVLNLGAIMMALAKVSG